MHVMKPTLSFWIKYITSASDVCNCYLQISPISPMRKIHNTGRSSSLSLTDYRIADGICVPNAIYISEDRYTIKTEIHFVI